MTYNDGDIKNFISNWKLRNESKYIHWTKFEPENQIQLAFKNHFEIFSEIIKKLLEKKELAKLKVLEVGSGRGSLSAHFSDSDASTFLLDLSHDILNSAKRVYKENRLEADFITADCLKIPFKSESFDVIFSIGLLEHFTNIKSVLEEQKRVLKKNGVIISYVVPERDSKCVQFEFEWVNSLLKIIFNKDDSIENNKISVFRSNFRSPIYVEIMKDLNFKNINVSGLYPLPMISYSTDFPFTLLPEEIEKKLVEVFSKILKTREQNFNQHPWLCEESYGQAFIVWGLK